ncbi:unnamed protein product [Meloidogyne enterolobii]|uniref:Uncharacterized protein n=1 Tax=Meloidogyne enterolobii TaxID=390850 RepID=A0ACB0ZZW1_MELEN
MLRMKYSCKEDIYMIILLPKERSGLEKMTKNLNGEKILKLLKCGYTAKVDVGVF